jgi:hypothetical protein
LAYRSGETNNIDNNAEDICDLSISFGREIRYICFGVETAGVPVGPIMICRVKVWDREVAFANGIVVGEDNAGNTGEEDRITFLS